MSEVKTQLELHGRQLTLHRFPKRSNETFQAWDAGDEYLINHMEEKRLPDNQNILIMNDSFGALSCWFSENHNVTMLSDSFISHKSTLQNLQRNHCNQIAFLEATEQLPANIDFVLVQIPKNNRFLCWQLFQLRSQLPSHCQIIAVNKAKEIHTSTLKLFEKYLGTTTTSLAWKKHRLVFSSSEQKVTETVPASTSWSTGNGIHLENLPNVYSGDSLDLGARFMLEHIPVGDDIKSIIDLGCGNGVLSVRAAQLNPTAQITSVDESYMAVESTNRNLIKNLGICDRFNCTANNCLDEFEGNQADLVLCNPPFHQQYAITDHIAWQMFCDAKHVLKSGGKLLVIGNRHLGYDVKLGRLFGKSQVKVIASNKKFVTLQATK